MPSRTSLPRSITALCFLALVALAAIMLTSCGRQNNQSASPRPAPYSRHMQEPRQPESNSAEESDRRERQPEDKSGKAPADNHEVRQEPAHTEEHAPVPHPTVSENPDTLAVELKRGPEDSKKIALTFDAGASGKPTPALLEVLRKNNVRATFFLTGRWVEQNPELVKEIVHDGHEIGNHTYSHPDLRKLSDDGIREQLEKTDELIRDAGGISTKPYFRAPYGARDDRVLEIAAADGYRSVYWTVDSWDAFKKGITAQEIKDRVLEKASDGSIVLMHCGSWPTVDAVPDIIAALKERGYELVTIGELAGAQGGA